MTWQCYQLVFRLLSPLRVGKREVGNLLETRPYVPGKVLWGALTARITRNQSMGHQPNAYQNIGNILRENMRFGYLWTSLDPPNPFYRWEDPEEFDYQLLGSYVSTALNYQHFSAEDGSLHEAEFIAPRTKSGAQVYLVGELWVRSGFENHSWQEAISQIQLGGERKYGWGRVSLVDGLQPKQEPAIADPDNFSWSGPIPAHLRIPDDPNPDMLGEIEPLLGWETQPDGRKRMSAESIIAFSPGTIATPDLPLRVSDTYGIWELYA